MATGPGIKRSDIQGLRAIAVLVVVFFHSGLPVPGGFVGVDIFFVISGFVIAAMLQREWHSSGRVRFGNFYLRRFKRLTPALALMVAVTILLSLIFLSPLGPQKTAGETAIGALLLVANFVIAATTGGYFGTAAEMNPLLHTWSLSVEEQFYLIFPILIVVAWRLARRGWSMTPFAAVGAVAALSFAVAAMGRLDLLELDSFSRRLIEFASGFYSPVTRAWEFAVGALLALALSRWNSPSGRILGPLGILGLGVLVMSVFLITEKTPFPGVWTLLPVGGTLLLLLSGTDASVPTTRLLSVQPMVRVGDWSYSIYLWHWPLIVFAGLIWERNALALVAAAAVSFIPAIISYRWVEEPIRNMSGMTRSRWGRLVAAVCLPPLLLATALLAGVSQGWGSSSVAKLQAAMARHASEKKDCNERRPLGAEQTSQCIWNKDANGHPIYLVGDSHAGHFSEAVIGAGKDLNRRVFIATPDSCPFVDLVVIDTSPNAENAACRRFVEGNLEYLSTAERGVVIISNRDSYWLNPTFEVGSPKAVNTSEQKLGMLRSGMTETIDKLRKAGHQVLLVQAVPSWRHWNPARCSLLAIVRGRCADAVPLQEAIAGTEEVRSVLADVGQRSGARVFDSVAPLCPEGICSTDAPSFVRYQDTHHISVPQAIDLTSDFREAISAAGSR